MRLAIFLLLFVLHSGIAVNSNAVSPNKSPTGPQKDSCCMLVTVVGDTLAYDKSCQEKCIRGLYIKDCKNLDPIATGNLEIYLNQIERIEGPLFIENTDARIIKLTFTSLKKIDVGYEDLIVRNYGFPLSSLMKLQESSISASNCNNIILEKNTDEPKILADAVKKAKETCLAMSTTKSVESWTAKANVNGVVPDDSTVDKFLGYNMSKSWFIAFIIISVTLLLVVIGFCVLSGFGFLRFKRVDSKSRWFDVLHSPRSLTRLGNNPTLKKMYDKKTNDLKEGEMRGAVKEFLEAELGNVTDNEIPIVQPNSKNLQPTKPLEMAMKDVKLNFELKGELRLRTELEQAVYRTETECKDAWNNYQKALEEKKKITNDVSHAINSDLNAMFKYELDEEKNDTKIYKAVSFFNKMGKLAMSLEVEKTKEQKEQKEIKIANRKYIASALSFASGRREVHYLLNTPFGKNKVYEDVALVKYIRNVLDAKNRLSMTCVDKLIKLGELRSGIDSKKSYVEPNKSFAESTGMDASVGIFYPNGKPVELNGELREESDREPQVKNDNVMLKNHQDAYASIGPGSPTKSDVKPKMVSEKLDTAKNLSKVDKNSGKKAETKTPSKM